MDTPDLSSLGGELIDIGLLIGLLGGTEASPTLNKGWFSNPKQGLVNNFDWPNLQPLIEKLLGKAANPMDLNAGPFNESWYSIKITDANGNPKDSGYYFVEKTVGSNALLGVGMQHTFTQTVASETVTIQPFLFVPVFQMPTTGGTTPIFGLDTNGPIELGVEVSFSDSFTYDGTAYDGMIFVASFDFTQLQPTITFLLKTSSGSFVPMPTISKQGIINTIMASTPVVNFLNSNVLPAASPIQFTWGGLFNSVGWLTTATAPYTVGTITIAGTPGALKNYIETLLLDALNKFLGTNQVTTLISKTGTTASPMAWSIGLVCNNGHYGINVQVTNVQVNASPAINLQLGALTQDKTDWISKAGGTTPVGMGLNFYILSGTAPNIAFDPQFEAINIGFDFAQTSGQPLFDISGYAIKEFQPRGYFSTLQNNAWGVAAAVENISLPLGPTSGSGSGVAQTLLSSADSSGDGSAKPPVNPEFSFIVAYQSDFYLQLFDKNNQPEDVVLIPIQKSFGPLELKDIGIGWQNDGYMLLFQMDGGLNLSALQLELQKLTVGVPITQPANLSAYTLDLDGFDLSFTSGDISLAGGFLKDTSTSPVEYDGAVTIQAARWGITALGSFASLNGSPSLFIYGALDAPLGGPPFFFVTGVAIGFGYNRKIVMPGIDQVQNFPFVQAAMNPSLFSGDSAKDVLGSIAQYIPPQLGEYWLAAGLKFTSFELLNSFALLMVQFGKTVEVDLLGMTSLQLPKQDGGAGNPYVNAEMAIKVTMEPDDGLLAVQAQLTNNSYVIDPACVISGGFAFNIWFSGEHSGDFVVTMGGYNASYTPPPYYPTVPRLAFNWNVSSSINFSGDAYFALTPSCVMAGGNLSLTYQDGDLRAWFKAAADFLISWKPFHYDIDISISIGVSYRINLLFVHKTITVELGVGLNVWGPPFGGIARVHLWIVSFSIGFGADNTPPGATIDWNTFEGYFLPKNDTTATETQLARPKMMEAFAATPLVAATTPTPSDLKNVIKINAGSGLTGKYTDTTSGIEYWLVDPATFNFNIESSIPTTQISFVADPNGHAPAPLSCTSFGLKPLGSVTLSGSDSDLLVGLAMEADDGSGNFTADNLTNWNFSTAPKNVPQALWGTVNNGSETPSSTSVSNITNGLTAASPPIPQLTGPGEFEIDLLSYTEIGPMSDLTVTAGSTAPVVTLSSTGSLTQIQNTLYNTSTSQNQCTGLFNALQDLGSLASQNDSLATMASGALNIFRDSPMLVNTTQSVTQTAIPSINYAAMPQNNLMGAMPQGHRLQAAITHYSFNGISTARLLRGGNLSSKANNLLNAVRTHSDLGNAGIFTMQHGSVQMWKLQPGAGSIFNYDGTLGLHLLLFDHNLEIIAEHRIPEGDAGYVPLPPDAVQMVIRTAGNAPAVSGWHIATHLPLLNPKYLLGKNCIVRPKSPHRTGRRQFSKGNGISNGRNITLKNKVETTHGKGRDGWVETRFTGPVSKVFVLGSPQWGLPDGDMLSSAFEVKVIYAGANGRKQAQTLAQTSAGIAGKELWAGYEIPAAALAATDFSLWVQTADGIYLSGVAAPANPTSDWDDDLTRNLLIPESYLHAGNSELSTVLRLENAFIYNPN